MKREWITDIDKMGFEPEDKKMIEKVIDYTNTILYYNGKDYKTEDPSDTYYFTSKDLLLEDMIYTYAELEKEGAFEETPAEEVDEEVSEEIVATYTATKRGARQFLADMWNDVEGALDNLGEVPTVTLTVGSRQIELVNIPCVFHDIDILIDDMIDEL